MSLDALADEIAAQAKAEAKALTDAAKKTAKSVKKEAEAEVVDIRESLMSRAERESAQLSTELVASSRQNNQKRKLIAKATELDATWDAKAEVGSAKLAGRPTAGGGCGAHRDATVASECAEAVAHRHRAAQARLEGVRAPPVRPRHETDRLERVRVKGRH